uniref:Importin N-terminal domain-containing protein n=1 Tax=Mucochytrium quahogii TaxID=96639 RepID=A0A7S2WQZ9_9STRA
MEQMLLQMNVPNTEIVKQAEKEITNAIKSKQCVPVFLQLLRFSQHQSVRQLSAVLLRLRVSKFWTELDGQTRNTAKELVLDALANEQSRIVSLNTMHVVASICTHEIQEAGWDSLLQFMHRCAVSSAPQQQELAMLLFYTLTGSLSQLCGDSFGQVKDLYMHVLQNSADPRVQVAALKASAALLNFHCDSEDVLAFQEFVPLILRGLAGNYNDDVLAVQLITIIGQIAECPMPIINTHIKETVELFLRIVSAAEVDEGTKQVAATTLVTLLECKTRFLMKQGLIPQVLNVSIMALAQDFQHFSTILGRQELSQAEMDAQKGQDDEQDDDNFLGRNLVGAIAEHCPARVIFSPMAEKAFQLMESNKMVNGEVPEQWMGLILLSTIIEFLTEEFSKPAVLEQLLLRTVPLAQNSPNVLIRVSALMVLSECVQFLGPSIFSYMPDMLPPAIQLMNDPKIAVKSCACDLLELICDDIEEDKILPYFDQLVNQLLVMVETAHNTSMQSTALCALSSLMVTTGPKFMPYFDSTCKKLSQFVSTTDESLLPVRGYAMAAFGNLALAASRPISEEEDSEKNNLALFAPLVQDILVCAQQGLEFEDMELSRNTYVMLGSLSEAFGEQIGNFINPIVDMLIIGLETNDQEEINCKDLDGAMVPEHLRDRFAGEDDDEDDDEDEQVYRPGVTWEYSIPTERIEAKQAALMAVARLCKSADPANLQPRMPELLQSTATILDHGLGGIEAEAVSTTTELVLALARAHPMAALTAQEQTMAADWAKTCNREVDINRKWLPGLPPKKKVNDEILRLVQQKIVPIFMDMVLTKDTRQVATACCNAIETLIAFLGPQVFSECLENLMTMSLTVLQGRAACQRTDQLDDEAQENEESAEEMNREGSELLDGVCDLVGLVAQACGPAFAPYAGAVFDEVLVKMKRGNNSKIAALGAMAEVLVGLGPQGAEPYLPTLVPAALAGLKEEGLGARRNGAYFTGNLVAFGGESLQQNVQAIQGLLVAIEPLLREAPAVDAASKRFPEGAILPFEVTDAQAMIDNACGALARIIYHCPQIAGSDEVVSLLLQTLPLRFDLTENFSVFQCISKLLKGNNSLLARDPAHLVQLCAKTLVINHNQELVLATQEIASVLRFLGENFGEQTSAAISSLSPDETHALEQLKLHYS